MKEKLFGLLLLLLAMSLLEYSWYKMTITTKILEKYLILDQWRTNMYYDIVEAFDSEVWFKYNITCFSKEYCDPCENLMKAYNVSDKVDCSILLPEVDPHNLQFFVPILITVREDNNTQLLINITQRVYRLVENIYPCGKVTYNIIDNETSKIYCYLRGYNVP